MDPKDRAQEIVKHYQDCPDWWPAGARYDTLRGLISDALNDVAERERLLTEAMRAYARPEHWMALTSEADSPNVVWIARSHLDATEHGYSTAYQVLMRLAGPAPEMPEKPAPDRDDPAFAAKRAAWDAAQRDELQKAIERAKAED